MADATEEPDCDFYIGEEFESLDSFNVKLRTYQLQKLCLFVTHRSEKSKDETVQFHSLKLKCKHFGTKRPNLKATGERALQKSYKIGCTAGIHVSGRASGKLVVTYFNNQHNHPCNRTTYYGYPEIRALSKESQEDIGKYAKLKAKPIHMKPLLKAKEGSSTIILGRDIHNAKAKQKRIEVNGRSEEEMLLDKLNEIKVNDPSASAHLQFNSESKEVEFVFIQTSAMRRALQKFPEVLIMDCTYKTNKNRMPVCIIEAIDGDGVGQPVAYAILSSESKDILTSVLLHFVTVSGERTFEKTACVLVDKSFAEIGAIRAVMPNAQVHICSVHAERAVKIGAKGDPNKKDVMKWFREMLHAENEKTFQAGYKGFNAVANEKTKKYLLDNWMHCKEVWSLKDRALVTTLREHSTNRVESMNRVMKIVADVDTPLHEAVSGFVDLIQGNRDDALRYRDHEALTKTVHINNCSDPTISKVCNELTLHAAKILCAQYEMALKPSPAPERQCIPWYDKKLIPERWHKEFNVGWWQNADVERETLKSQVTITKRMPAEPVTRILSASDKFKKSRLVTEKLDGILTNSGTKVFHQRFQFLKDLEEAWSKGREVTLLHHSGSVVGNAGNVGVVLDNVDLEGKEDNGKKKETAPFRLTSQKVIGRSRGLKETIHDGSKQKSATKVKHLPSISTIVRLNTGDASTLCCVCKREAGEHHCSKCGKVVHAIPPCSVPGPEEGYGKSCLCTHCEGKVPEGQDVLDDMVMLEDTCTTITVPLEVSDSSEKKSASKVEYLPSTSTITLVAPEAVCCVCKREAGDHHCSTCRRVVHAIPPCSTPGPEEGFGKSCLCTLCEAAQLESKPIIKFPKRYNNSIIVITLSSDDEDHHEEHLERLSNKPSIRTPDRNMMRDSDASSQSDDDFGAENNQSHLQRIMNESNGYTPDGSANNDSDAASQSVEDDIGAENDQAHQERMMNEHSGYTPDGSANNDSDAASQSDEDDLRAEKNDAHFERVMSQSSGYSPTSGLEDFDVSEHSVSEVQKTLTENGTQDPSAKDKIRATQASATTDVASRNDEFHQKSLTNDVSGLTPNDARGVTDAEKRSENSPPFQLKVMKTSGRPKTTASSKHTPKWNFSALSSKSGIQCCICNKEAEDDKCSSCSNVVHSHLPCSVLKPDSSERICNYCCDIKNEDYYPGVPKSQRLYRKEPPYFCHACEFMLKLFVAKNPKDPKRKGSFYFGCLKKLSPGCLSFLFWWSPKQPLKDVDSSSYMGFHLDDAGDQIIRSMPNPPSQTAQRGKKRRNEESEENEESQQANSQVANSSQPRRSLRPPVKKIVFTPTK